MVHSAAGVALPAGGLVTRPPLRAPHHTASLVAMVGGGTAALRPGEASLAHGGVLLLDELAEFQPAVLDGLRQPLEEGVIRVIRAKAAVEFPSRFLLVGDHEPLPVRCSRARVVHVRHGRAAAVPPPGVRARCSTASTCASSVRRPSVEELLGGPAAESSAAVAAAWWRPAGWPSSASAC